MCVCPLRAYTAPALNRGHAEPSFTETVRQFTPRGLQENVTERETQSRAKSWRGLVGARGPGSAHG